MAPLPDVDAITKLFGVVLSGIGAARLLEPWNKKRLARATAEEMKVLAQADIDVQKMRLEGKKELADLEAKLLPASSASMSPVVFDAELVPASEPSPLLLTRVRERTEYQEAKRQINIEQVAVEAANELRGQQASAEPVDEDWVARFFESAKDVSSEEMQKLWAKILAGEVVRPGSFSLRCIESVRNLTMYEARMVESLRPYVVADRFILRGSGHFESGQNDRLGDVVRLAEAGIFTGDVQLSFVQTFLAGKVTPLLMSDLVLMVTAETERKETFNAYILTSVGIELMRLFRLPADRAYARALVDRLRRSKYKVETFAGTHHGNQFSWSSTVDIFPPKPPPTTGAESTEVQPAASDKSAGS